MAKAESFIVRIGAKIEGFESLKKLLDDLNTQKKRLKVYRQMKMYNDKSLNPFLYQRKNTDEAKIL